MMITPIVCSGMTLEDCKKHIVIAVCRALPSLCSLCSLTIAKLTDHIPRCRYAYGDSREWTDEGHKSLDRIFGGSSPTIDSDRGVQCGEKTTKNGYNCVTLARQSELNRTFRKQQ